MADAPNIHTLIPHVENTAVKTSPPERHLPPISPVESYSRCPGMAVNRMMVGIFSPPSRTTCA